MASRRTFLKAAATGAGGVWLSGYGRPRWASVSADTAPLAGALADGRHREAAAFAAALREGGIPSFSVTRDIGTLWYHELRERLRHASVPLAGLTDPTTLFCLEELARDVGMRLQYRIDHVFRRDGTVSHDAAGAQSLIRSARRLPTVAGFGTVTAELAIEQARTGEASTAALRRRGVGSASSGRALVSWLLIS